MSGGTQIVSAGGIGNVVDMGGGQQIISEGGIGSVGTVSGAGKMEVYAGGTGSVGTLNGGNASQGISGLATVSAVGYIGTLQSGNQVVSTNAVGSVTNLLGGGQRVEATGTGYVDTMSGGQQIISNGAVGSITTLNGGSQFIFDKAEGTVGTMNGGSQVISGGAIAELQAKGTITSLGGSGIQTISANAIGSITSMGGGKQNVAKGGTGLVTVLTAGVQNVLASATGSVTTMKGNGQQIIYGSGHIGTLMEGGQQFISAGDGTIELVLGGTQTVSAYVLGTIDLISGNTSALQQVYIGATGQINTMNNVSGSQTIEKDGSGNITDLKAGAQIVYSGGNGSIEQMNGTEESKQTVSAGGTGNIKTMNNVSGAQTIEYSGTGKIEELQAGQQTVAGNGSIDKMYGGAQTVVSGAGASSGGVGIITAMTGGIQTIDKNAQGTITEITGTEASKQNVKAGGTGNIGTMNNVSAGQDIAANAKGTITTLQAGQQTVFGSGYISTMSGGSQVVNHDATGEIETMSAGGSQVISAYGSGTVATMSGGKQNVGVDATGTITTMVNGVQEIDAGGAGTITTMNDGSQKINLGGTGTVTALNGGQQSVSVGGTSLNTTVNGGTLVVLDDAAVVKNAAIDAGALRFNGAGASYKLTGSFAARGGTVDLTTNADGTPQVPGTYETLTIDNLSGNGTNFLMNTDLNSETNGDKLVIQAAAANAGGTIQVYDKSLVDGTNVEPEKKLLLVTDNSGITTWTGKSLDTGGLWTITPTVEHVGNEWYLKLTTPPPTPTPTPTPSITLNTTARTLVAFSDAAYGAWRNAITDDSLRMHLGDLRYNEVQPGVWARVKAGKLGAPGYTGSYQLYQVGIDQQYANTAFGVAIDHLVGSNDYLDGKGDSSMTNLSLYATSYHPSGVYSDVVVKAGRYRGDISRNSVNDAADYGTWGYSASYELGKTIIKGNGFFIEPETQFILGRLQGADYTSNKGVSANADAATSFLGRVGFVAGRKLAKGGDYYFKANMWREFAGNGETKLSAINSFGDREYLTQSTGHHDTWFTLGLGSNIKLAPMTHFYGDIEKTFGADVQKKWQVNAGVRWEF